MGGWEKWSANRGAVFPLLQELHIEDCPNLVEVTLEALPSLNVLKLHECPNLIDVSVEALPSLNVLQIHRCDSGVVRGLVELVSAVTNLEIRFISGLNDVVWREVIKYLGTVQELSIERCNEITYLWESEAVASTFLLNLNHLWVRGCGNLVSLGEKEEDDNCRSNLLTSLKRLTVSSCDYIKRCSCPYNIEELKVKYCNSITDISLPIGGQKLKSLEIDGCEKLLEREWGGQKMLESVYISDWPNQKSINELKYLVHLTTLSISNCENLESFPDNELPNLLLLKKLEIVDCVNMDVCFPGGVWPPNLCSLWIGKLKKPISKWGPQLNFPTSLVELELYGGDGEDGVSSCSQISHLLPSSLTSLTIHGFEKLESVSEGLQHLTSLQRLEFWECPNLKKVSHLQYLTSLQDLSFDFCPSLNELSHPHPHTSLQHLYFCSCPNMMDLPEMILPSLLSLSIWDNCPKLKERWSKGGSHWHLISHIPYIEIMGS